MRGPDLGLMGGILQNPEIGEGLLITLGGYCDQFNPI